MIFCVEDDGNIRELVVYTLESTGFQARGFEDGSSFLEALALETPELVLLDIMLPGEDGMELLRKLKASKKTKEIPVIMVTAKGAEYDKVKGLDAGADDYVTKPFGMMEMISRIKAVLRRSAPAEESKTLCIGDLALDMSQHIVTVLGKRVQLTLKEYELLRLFMENPGRAYTRDQLLSKIWGSDYIGETRTVDVHIGTLRTKLGSCGDYIETVRGVGYRMEGRL